MGRGPAEPVPEPTPLADHLAWLESIGQLPGCPCSYRWRSLGYREGRRNIAAGWGWVRTSTARDCPAHGSRSPVEATAAGPTH